MAVSATVMRAGGGAAVSLFSPLAQATRAKSTAAEAPRYIRPSIVKRGTKARRSEFVRPRPFSLRTDQRHLDPVGRGVGVEVLGQLVLGRRVHQLEGRTGFPGLPELRGPDPQGWLRADGEQRDRVVLALERPGLEIGVPAPRTPLRRRGVECLNHAAECRELVEQI